MAIAMAQPRDIILLAGKGHESYQEFADHTLPFDDAAIAASALGSRVEFESPSLRPRNPREHSEDRPLDAEERRRRRENRDQ